MCDLQMLCTIQHLFLYSHEVMLCHVLVFQWFGDAEKLTKALFSLARKLSPAVIFVDEVSTEHTLLVVKPLVLIHL